MNITDNLIRIKDAKDNIIKSLKNKGVSINDNTLINEIPTIIDNAEIGGGGDTPSVPTELVPKYEGASVFRIVVPEDNYEFAINLCNDATKATYDVDWGDGSLESGLTTDEQHHTYSKKGTYDVNVYNISKDISLGGYTNSSGISSVTVIYLFNNTNTDYWLGNTYNYQTDNTVTNILIGDKITTIGQFAFNGCSSLQSIVIPEGVTKINIKVFQNCSSLQSVVILEGITSISDGTFSGCSSLQSVVLPESLTSIGSSVFEYCSSLQSIVIPDSVTSIGSSVFKYCSSLQSIVIPDSVTSIGSSAFNGCSSLQSVVLPESLTSIGEYAFTACSSLTSIIIPDSVTTISSSAFQNCSSLQSIVIPEGVTSIGSNAFQNCSSLQSIVIPEGVTKINNSTFEKCYSLTYIDLPSTLTSIGSSNFYGSYSILIQLHYIISRAKTAPTIQSSTFQYSVSNGILYIPKDADITTYQSSYWKSNLLDKGWTIEYIEDIPEKVPSTIEFTTVNDNLIKVSSLGKGQLISEEKIDNKYIYNFDDTIYLGENILPKSLITTMKFIGGVELGDMCCKNWTTLQSIDLPNLVNRISDYAFENCSALQSIIIPDSVTSIGNNAFSGCSSLPSVVIPESVTSIGSTAFYRCSSLQSVDLPSGITEIKGSTFYDCTAVHTFICRAMVAPTSANATWNNLGSKVPSGTPKILYIPEGATGYDNSNTYWNEFFIKGFTIKYLSELPTNEL